MYSLFSFLVAKLLYKSKCSSLRISVCQPRLGGNVIFSAPNWDIAPIFFVQIPIINEHLFCKYLTLCLSVMPQKLCYLWMFSSLFISNPWRREANIIWIKIDIKWNYLVCTNSEFNIVNTATIVNEIIWNTFIWNKITRNTPDLYNITKTELNICKFLVVSKFFLISW